MRVTRHIIPHIETAMGFRLYDHQIKFILNKGALKPGRKTGKTTAYCIKLALTDGPPLNLRRPENFSDGWELKNHRTYARYVFIYKFLKIRKALENYGLPVRAVTGFDSVYNSRRRYS